MFQMLQSPGRLGGSRAAPDAVARVVGTRPPSFQTARSLAAPPGGAREGKLVGGAYGKKENLVDLLRREVGEERRKRGRAEHEYKIIRIKLAQEKSKRCKVEQILAEAKVEIKLLKGMSEQNKREEEDLFMEVGEDMPMEAGVEQDEEGLFQDDEMFDTPGVMSQHLRSALASDASRVATEASGAANSLYTAAVTISDPSLAFYSPAAAVSIIRAPATYSKASPTVSNLGVAATGSRATPADSNLLGATEATFPSATAVSRFTFRRKPDTHKEEAETENNKLDSKEVNLKQKYKFTPDHVKIIQNLPKLEQEIFRKVQKRLSGPSNFHFMELLHNGTSGEDTVEAFQLNKETFLAKYGEEFQVAEKVIAAGPTGGRGNDTARDAVMRTKSTSWAMGITWMFNSLTEFVADNPEFR